MISHLGLWVESIGAQVCFFGKVNKTLLTERLDTRLLSEQIWKVTVQSIPTTCFAGFFVGGIMTIQFTLQVKEFGAMGYLGGLATSGTIREIGPLLIAFMLSGKVGAFTSAELGTMRVTEQIDALRCLGANPIQEVIVPRYLAIIISSFILLVFGLMMSFFGGVFMAQIFSGINYDEYIRHIPRIVNPLSVLSGVIKCFSFSILLATVCTYYGYETTGGARGVGRAVVKTSIFTMVGIVVLDWLTSFVGDIVFTFFLLN